MKRLRRHPMFLAVIALALPLGLAFLSYDFYDDSDFAPGILQSDISKSAESSSWPALYNYNRPLSRESKTALSYKPWNINEFL